MMATPAGYNFQTAPWAGGQMTATQGMPPQGQPASSDMPSWLSDLSSLLQAGGSIFNTVNGLSTSNQLTDAAGKVLAQSNPFGPYRDQYAKQLNDLMSNPSSVTSLPGYSFLMDQGVQAIDRSAAGRSGLGLGSGGEKQALEEYGQGLASSFYNTQVNTLSNLAGAQFPPANPAQALAARGGALTSQGGAINAATNPANPGSLVGSAQNIYNLYNDMFGGGGVSQTDLSSMAPGGYDPGTVSDLFTNEGQVTGDGGFNFGDLFSSPSGAGGQAATGIQSIDASNAASTFQMDPGVTDSINRAATSTPSNASVGLGAVGDVYGIYSGLRQGGVRGDTQAALDTYKLYGQVSPLLASSTLPAGVTAAASAADATAAASSFAMDPAAVEAINAAAGEGGAATGAAAASSTPASSGLGAVGGAAAAIAIPAAIAYVGLQNQQTNSGLAFVQSLGGSQVNGKYGGMFTQPQYNQIQQQYHSLGEDGFWQWFNQTYPGFTGPGTSGIRASYNQN